MSKDSNNNSKGGGSNNNNKNGKSWKQKQQSLLPKQSKVILKLGRPLDIKHTPSVKLFDKLDIEVKERIPDNRDEDPITILVKGYKKAILICSVYSLYNNKGDWKAVVQAQHRSFNGECKDD